MTNLTPDDRREDEDALLDDVLVGDDDRPLDPDADDDQVNSADADQRAATEGEIDVDELP